jgi:hypothetical protein
MSHRSTPERLEVAWHAATRNRLIGEGMTEATADAWIVAWTDQPAAEGLEHGAGWWDRGYKWIISERQHRVRP